MPINLETDEISTMWNFAPQKVHIHISEFCQQRWSSFWKFAHQIYTQLDALKGPHFHNFLLDMYIVFMYISVKWSEFR